jgi:hypothetical protein
LLIVHRSGSHSARTGQDRERVLKSAQGFYSPRKAALELPDSRDVEDDSYVLDVACVLD